MVMPVASMIFASLGMVTELDAPTAVIFPPWITRVPFSITPWVMVRSLPPFRAMGWSWVNAGVERIESKNKGKTRINGSGRGRPLHTGLGCIILPPCSGWFPGLVERGRSRFLHRSELFPGHRNWIADIRPRVRDRHLCLHRSNLLDLPRL